MSLNKNPKQETGFSQSSKTKLGNLKSSITKFKRDNFANTRERNKIEINVTNSSPQSERDTLLDLNTSSKCSFNKKIGKLSTSNNSLTVPSGYHSGPSHRRESFLYRTDTDIDNHVKMPIRSASIASTIEG